MSEDSIGLREEYTLLTDAWFVYGVYRHFQQYFSHIVAIRFTGEENRSIRRKPPTFRKSLTNFIT